MTPTNEIGERIRMARLSQKISQKKLSQLAFGSESNHTIICKIEKGTQEVRFETIFLVLRALGIDIFHILDGLTDKK